MRADSSKQIKIGAVLSYISIAIEKFIELKIADIINRILIVNITVVMLYCGYGRKVC